MRTALMEKSVMRTGSRENATMNPKRRMNKAADG
jgi:hypothetical protein